MIDLWMMPRCTVLRGVGIALALRRLVLKAPTVVAARPRIGRVGDFRPQHKPLSPHASEKMQLGNLWNRAADSISH